MHRPLAATAPFHSGFVAAKGFWLRTQEMERSQLSLWLPVMLGSGVAFYFSLPREPEFWIAPAFFAFAATFAVLSRANAAAFTLASALAATALGFGVAQFRTDDVAAPVLEQRLASVAVAGRIVAIEPRAEGVRLLLDRLSIAGRDPARTPERIRVRVDTADGLAPGDEIRLARVALVPPPGPSAPGAFDFARQAWFEQLGAVGSARGAPELVARGEASDLRLAMNALRARVVARIRAILPEPAGAIAIALIAGEQGAVSSEALAAFRDSGLQHILSISGLHIGMVAGIVFFSVRFALALLPRAALYWNTKKIAAVAAFLAITFYAAFAVQSVPTQRSWLMTGVVLGAVLIDRQAITLRLVAWAAGLLLLVMPEALASASFQMSFAAVIALVAAWEATRGTFARLRASGNWRGRVGVWLLGTVMTSLVAGLASAPFALYHFNRFTVYALLANLLAVPLTGLWVMPLALAAGLLLPFGLEAWALVPMGWGIDGLLAIAERVASLDGAVALLPSMPMAGLVAVAAGLLWLSLWRSAWRVAGIVPVLAGLLSIGSVVPPDILVSGDGRLMAVRDAEGRLTLSVPRGDRFARETWLRRDAQEEAESWPRNGVTADGRLECRPSDCVYRANGKSVAIVRQARVLPSACRERDLVIATVNLFNVCRAAAGQTVDRFDLLRDGAHAIWITQEGIRIETVRDARGARPWVPAIPERPPGRVQPVELPAALN
jgi:competence protein ComEC